ncbi:low-specificity L-threonine aldolase [Acidihalobacter prosperus]|uniref:Threonine aldolase n=1 Tax=Acidihalobacter prosperus TaxID=160660 RepID=A0A1A6C4G3_9GAMM|nr:low-specificity L-threonine aldolase [Acidihalobacter prosperus]OBS09451.1 threonine aldolase [Acidihalobacter prosperus]
MDGSDRASETTVDLRSDTLTRPTDSMREAMARAEVGDDVYGEDPTVNALEALAAERLGKAAALFVPSGTMGNLISVLAQCGRGDEMILGADAHIFYYEQGGAAGFGGVQPRTLANRADGTLDLAEVEAAIRADNDHYPVTRLIALENTHNRCGGRVLGVDYMDAAAALAHARGLRLHVDGARIWNAAVALGVSPARLLAGADSVSACLSKGLSAPVGSVVAGDRDFIRRARRLRKALGGGMRQAGVIAAAGIVALEEMVERLAEDHANARLLANGLAALDGVRIDPTAVQTNLVYFELARPGPDAGDFCAALERRGVRMGATSATGVRAVIHRHVHAAAVDRTLAAVAETLRAAAA